MLKYFESKVKGLHKEDFAVGPMQVPNDLRGSSFLVDDPQHKTTTPLPGVPNDTPAQASVNTIDEGDDDDDVRPSNEYVLNVAFFSFLGFMAVQAFFALIANSESMLADSEAMSVDALTYLFNMCAERIKNRPYSEVELSLPTPVRVRRRTMKRLYLELVPPLISVTTLVIVTVYVLNDSLHTLFGTDPEFEKTKDDVDVGVMLLFSGINLLLDIVNVTCFARANQAFGLQSVGSKSTDRKQKRTNDLVKMTSVGAEVELNEIIATESTRLVADEDAARMEKENPYGPNLNMCSAWTHVCADTMRSIAVLLAAGIATVFSSVDGDVADATAAVVVSLIIIVSLFPLLYGLFLTAREIVILSRTPIS